MGYGDILYNRLPDIYKKEDRLAVAPYQLQKFLSIMGAGFDEVSNDITNYTNNFDMALADASTIDPSAKLLGFNFPYTMTTTEKRSLIKILPLLYRNKGNAKVFEYLGNLVFGQPDKEVVIDLEKSTIVIGDNPNAFCITLTVSYWDDLANLTNKLSNYIIFVEEFRPVNLFLKYVFKPHTEEIAAFAFGEYLDEFLIITTEDSVVNPFIDFLLDRFLIPDVDNYSIISPYMDEPVGLNISRLSDNFIFATWQNPFYDYISEKYYATKYFHLSSGDLYESLTLNIPSNEVLEKTFGEEEEISLVESKEDIYTLFRVDRLSLLNNSDFRLNSTFQIFSIMPDEIFEKELRTEAFNLVINDDYNPFKIKEEEIWEDGFVEEDIILLEENYVEQCIGLYLVFIDMPINRYIEAKNFTETIAKEHEDRIVSIIEVGIPRGTFLSGDAFLLNTSLLNSSTNTGIGWTDDHYDSINYV